MEQIDQVLTFWETQAHQPKASVLDSVPYPLSSPAKVRLDFRALWQGSPEPFPHLTSQTVRCLTTEVTEGQQEAPIQVECTGLAQGRILCLRCLSSSISRRSPTTSFAPSAAKSFAVARPMPAEALVMRATLF